MSDQSNSALPMHASRAVVTGGAGFIGSHIVDALIAAGSEVHVVDNLATGKRDRVHSDAAFHLVDVADANALSAFREAVGPVDVWYHMAAQADVRVSVDDPVADAMTNIVGTIRVLETAAHDSAQVVLASTGGAIYGDVIPPTVEHSTIQPESPYGAAKYAAETYVGTWARLHGAPHAIVRYANVYGPRQDPHGEAGVVAIFGGRLLDGEGVTIFGDGSATRDYVYVGDVVQATIAAGRAAAARPRASWRDVPVYNVGSGVETSVLDLWTTLQQVAGLESSYTCADPRPGELQRSALDASRARTELGIPIDTPLSVGLNETVAWMRAERLHSPS